MNKIKKDMIPLRKNTFIAFSISVIVLILTFAASQWFIVKIEKENFMKELEAQTKESLSFTKFLFDGMVEDLKHISSVLQEYDDLLDPQAKEKLRFSHPLDFYNATFVSDLDGNAYDYSGLVFSIANEDFFQAALHSNGLIFSDILPSERFGTIQIISLPIYSHSDPQKINGYLFGLYDIDKFSQSIDTLLDNNQYLYIVDSNGTYINTFTEQQKISSTQNFWDDFSRVKMNDTSIEVLKQNFDNHKEGSFSYSYGNVHRYGYHIPLGIKDWQIVFSMEKSVMDSRVRGLSRLAAIASIINWICLIIMLWSIYRYFKAANKEIRKASDRISKSNEIIRVAVESSNRVIFEYDIKKKSIDLKTKIPHQIFNSTTAFNVPDSFINANTVADSSVANLKALFERIEEESSSQADIQIMHGAGESVWYRIALKNIYNDSGHIITTVGSAEDISLLKQGEEAIKRKEGIHKTLINTSLLFASVDLSTGVIFELNGKPTNLSYLEYLNEKVTKYVCKEHISYVFQSLSPETLMEEYLLGKEYIEVQYKREINHEIRWTSTIVYHVHESEGPNVAFVIRDIHEQKCTEIALKEQAEIDGLTKLYNAATTRTKIRDVLSLPHTSEEKQIFILLDLDNFKKVNDTLGHMTGDLALIDAADKLRHHFRSSDIVGRLGGDEFVAMLCDVKSDYYVDIIANALIPELMQTYMQGDVSVTVSASMGIAVSPDDGITFEELYQKADASLYQVKERGKNGYARWEE